MSIPSTSWNENAPAGSDNVSSGDDRIREMKTQIREVIDVDHDFPSSGNAADNGQHKRVTLQEQANLGTGAEGVPILGAQTVGGKAELVFTDEDDNDIQLTSGGKLDLGSGRLDNDEALTSRNNAGDGDLNLIKANASDQAVITPALLASGGAILPEITAPATAANQGAIYTKNDGTQTELYFREESNGDEVQITDGGVVVSSTPTEQLVKAWAYYKGTDTGTVTALASYNITSIVRNSAGNWTITWATDFSDANYVIFLQYGGTSTDGRASMRVYSQAAGNCVITCSDANNTAVDVTFVHVMALGAQ